LVLRYDFIGQPDSRANAAEREGSADGLGLSSADFAPDAFGLSPPHRSLFSFGMKNPRYNGKPLLRLIELYVIRG
jgi:hypothetical protein